jgi:hypothetical protein
MKIPDNLPEKQERALLLVRAAIQSIGMKVIKSGYELGTGSIVLSFGLDKKIQGKVVISEDGQRRWQTTNLI